MATKKEIVEAREESKFSKEQILSSKRYSNRRDALGVILEDEKLYGITEVDELLDNFMKGMVN